MATNQNQREREIFKGLRAGHDMKRWKPEEARQWLEEWKKSGLSVAEFCRRNNLEIHRIHWWKRRYREWMGDEKKSDTGSTAQIRWVEAQVRSYRKEMQPEVVIRLRTGDEIEITDSNRIPADWLAVLTQGLLG